MPNDSKNTLVFIVIAMAMLLLYQMFVMQPAMQRKQAEARAQAAAAQANKPAAVAAPGVVPAGVPAAPPPIVAPRIPIDTPSLKGSLSLAGGRIDSLDLKRYHETLAPSSPLVGLFRPAGKPGAYFADFGWTGANLPGLPDARTVWTARSTGPLAPNRPLVLTYRSPQGLDFTRVVSVDDKYMFTVKDTVANYGAAPVTIAPYATVQRQGLPQSHAQNVHEGGIGVADGKLKLFKYGSWKKKTPSVDLTSTGGWFGITDKYWMAAVIPEQAQAVRATFRVTQPGGQDVYDASYLGGYKIIAPGKQTTWTSRLFAGAKTVPILKSYKDAGIPRFEDAVDWGWFWFFTKPIFSLLHVFYQLMGNFGLAIMLLTVVIKVLFFWPANKSYESMTKMKKVQPELEQIKKRHKDDPAKQQQAMMALYAQEKINPFMGCLPILATIPVFFALFKVLTVTIEMRHAPFYGWVQDLSARDPSTIWTLFGAIPWNPALVPLIGQFLDGPLHIGFWAITYGVTTWLTQAMSPSTGMDPTQQRIMQFFPLIFTFVLAQFAVGLLIYYTWSNLLGIVQQYVIMRRFKVDNPIDQIVRRLRGFGQAAEG